MESTLLLKRKKVVLTNNIINFFYRFYPTTSISPPAGVSFVCCFTLVRRFWNQILTWIDKKEREKGKNLCLFHLTLFSLIFLKATWRDYFGLSLCNETSSPPYCYSVPPSINHTVYHSWKLIFILLISSFSYHLMGIFLTLCSMVFIGIYCSHIITRGNYRLYMCGFVLIAKKRQITMKLFLGWYDYG